jgi:hypothetical protein
MISSLEGFDRRPIAQQSPAGKPKCEDIVATGRLVVLAVDWKAGEMVLQKRANPAMPGKGDRPAGRATRDRGFHSRNDSRLRGERRFPAMEALQRIRKKPVRCLFEFWLRQVSRCRSVVLAHLGHGFHLASRRRGENRGPVHRFLLRAGENMRQRFDPAA